MTKQEILQLHTLTEYQQKVQLIAWGILETEEGEKGECLTESLADCAFRLRDEVCGKPDREGKVGDACRAVFELNAEGDCVTELLWWKFTASPTNWIQAALLAKLESEDNNG